jgi:3-hydroxyisobutyrate dehydrogenase
VNIAFIGLGNMGFPMAVLLANAGHDVYARDVAAAALERFESIATTAHQLSDADWSSVEVVITMLPNSNIVEQVLLEDGVVDAVPPGTLIVDMSSSEPIRSRNLSSMLVDKKLRYVDAPVSGGVAGAEAGTLAIMTGGNEADLSQAQPLFDILGKSTVHVGEVGAGHAAKALNNLVSATSLLVTVEALHIAERFGISGDRFVDVLNASSGRSNTSENKVRQFMLSGTYASGFPIGLMTKDIDIAIDLAESLRVDIQLASEVVKIWRHVRDSGHASEDHTRMYDFA